MPEPTLRAPSPVLALCLAILTGPGAAQFDPDAPEPIPRLRGSLVLGGGGALPDAAWARFLTLAGGAEARVVLLGGEVGDALRGRFEGRVKGQREVHAPSRAAAGELRGSFAGVSGVWIADGAAADFAARYRGTPVEAGLREVIARGGVVGGNGPVVRALAATMIVGGQPHPTVGAGLDLVPGAVLDDDFSGAQRRDRLLGVITAAPTLVGLGIDAGTAMVLQHRFIDVLGAGSVYGCVASSARRPVRVVRVNRGESPASQRRVGAAGRGAPASGPRGGGRRGVAGRRGGDRPRRLEDLIALSRSARARVAPRFPAWDPPAPNVESGALVIVGGGGMPQGLLEKFIELAGGPDAPLVYVPCTEEEVLAQPPRMLDAFRRAGAKDVDWVHTKDRRAADGDAQLLGKLRRAKGIWFGGGRQWNLVDSYQHTEAHRLMHDVLARGGVIGGSSAGASIQGGYMVRGNSLGNLDPMAEGYETGLGFLTGVAIDQHFAQRNRMPDMTALVGTYPELLGIGLDEASSIVVRGTVAEVCAREGRQVHVYDRRKPVVPGERDHVLLDHGQRYDLAARKVLESGK